MFLAHFADRLLFYFVLTSIQNVNIHPSIFYFLPTIWLPLEISPGTGARAPKIIIFPVGMDFDESSWIFRGEHVFCFSADFKVPRCRIGPVNAVNNW